jgi:Ankyrin repeats (3 copies)/Phosphate transport (Pho88)
MDAPLLVCCPLIIFLSAKIQPFGVDPNAKKKYTESSYAAHVNSVARSLLGSTFFGVLMTIGFHYYKGMVMGLAIQTVMGPLNLFENAIVRAMLLGNGVNPADRIFEEKLANELTAESDEVVDEHGAPINLQTIVAAAGKQQSRTQSSKDASSNASSTSATSLEDVLLDTWDQGNKADLGPLMKLLNKSNVNYQTKEDKWTPLMILAGLGAKGAVSAIRAVREMGADPALVDKEGWTALHWAAFHGCLPAAQELGNETALLKVKDKEGNTPVETARQEGNDSVAAAYEKVLGENKKSK